jgi:hypothetical protein
MGSGGGGGGDAAVVVVVDAGAAVTVIVIDVLAFLPPVSVTDAVIVCVPTGRLPLLIEAPVPSGPMMLDVHSMLDEMVPSSASIALPVNVTFVDAWNEAPLSGDEIITVGVAFAAVTRICLVAVSVPPGPLTVRVAV